MCFMGKKNKDRADKRKAKAEQKALEHKVQGKETHESEAQESGVQEKETQAKAVNPDNLEQIIDLQAVSQDQEPDRCASETGYNPKTRLESVLDFLNIPRLAKKIDRFVYTEKGFTYFISSIAGLTMFALAVIYAADVHFSKKEESDARSLLIYKSAKTDNLSVSQLLPADYSAKRMLLDKITSDSTDEIRKSEFTSSMYVDVTGEVEENTFADKLRIRYDLEIKNIIRCIKKNVKGDEQYNLRGSFEIKLDDASRAEVMISLGNILKLGSHLIQYGIVDTNTLLQIKTAAYNLENNKRLTKSEFARFERNYDSY